MKSIILVLFILLPSISFSQKVTVPVFQNNRIQFGDSSNQGSVIVSDKGRIISKKVTLPDIKNRFKLLQE